MPTTYRLTKAEVTGRTPGARSVLWAAVLTFPDGSTHDTGAHCAYEASPPIEDGSPRYHHTTSVAAMLANATDAAGYAAAIDADVQRVIADLEAAADPDPLDLSHLVVGS